MCKVAGVTKITDKNRDDVWLFMQMLGDYMSKGNPHGLGYAAFNKAGNIFGEKWLINDLAFTDISMRVKDLTAAKMDQIYQYFGDKVLRDEAQAIILHTRFATCEIGIQNTHPFVNDIQKPDVAIIHNGMINNHMRFDKKFGTCDSEVLAHLYHDNKVNESVKKVNDFVNKISGWFTVLNLSKTPENKMVLDAYSDSGRLESYYIPELETRIYSTSGEDIKKTAAFLGLTVKQHMKMRADTSFRVDVLTGEAIEVVKHPKPAQTWKKSEADWSGLDRQLPSNVYRASGSLDDEKFRDLFFSGLNGATNYRK